MVKWLSERLVSGALTSDEINKHHYKWRLAMPHEKWAISFLLIRVFGSFKRFISAQKLSLCIGFMADNGRPCRGCITGYVSSSRGIARDNPFFVFLQNKTHNKAEAMWTQDSHSIAMALCQRTGAFTQTHSTNLELKSRKYTCHVDDDQPWWGNN